MTFRPLFVQLTGKQGSRRFAVLHLPSGGQAPVGLVVHAPAFAEEMNKSRRMVALQARALAAAGVAVLIPDLYGCGDSPGNMAGASWSGWVTDVADCQRWMRAEQERRWPGQPQVPCALWGLRSGALLAAAAARELAEVCDLLVWQPTVHGRTALQQFMRLLSAGEMLGGKAQGAAAQARAALAAGGSWEIAGYQLPGAVALGMESATFEPPGTAGRLVAFELSQRSEPSLTPALAANMSRWQAAGWHTRAEVVQGPAFWQTTEIEDAPELIDATSRGLAAAWLQPDLVATDAQAA